MCSIIYNILLNINISIEFTKLKKIQKNVDKNFIYRLRLTCIIYETIMNVFSFIYILYKYDVAIYSYNQISFIEN